MRCATCGEPATCWGAYEGSEVVGLACDDCCGHGGEDGWCHPIECHGCSAAKPGRRRVLWQEPCSVCEGGGMNDGKALEWAEEGA